MARIGVHPRPSHGYAERSQTQMRSWVHGNPTGRLRSLNQHPWDCEFIRFLSPYMCVGSLWNGLGCTYDLHTIWPSGRRPKLGPGNLGTPQEGLGGSISILGIVHLSYFFKFLSPYQCVWSLWHGLGCTHDLHTVMPSGRRPK